MAVERVPSPELESSLACSLRVAKSWWGLSRVHDSRGLYKKLSMSGACNVAEAGFSFETPKAENFE